MADIKDVAKRAGVSPALVSRVLNDRPGVSPENRTRIAAAIAELGYRRNDLARSLVQQHTGAIGVILDSLCLVFMFELIQGLEDAGLEAGYNVVFCDSQGRPDSKARYIEYLSHNRVDGLILYGSLLSDNVLVRELSASGFPFVLIENDAEGIAANKVLLDNRDGAIQMVRHFHNLGHRDIRMVCWGMDTFAGRERHEGFLDGLQAFSLPVTGKTSLCVEGTVAGGHAVSEAMQILIDAGDLPDALFFGSDQIAFEAIPILTARGIRIPQDIAIGGFDQDVHLGTGFPMPPLTTIAQPLREMGKDAVELLCAVIRGGVPESRTHLFKGRFIKGDTT